REAVRTSCKIFSAFGSTEAMAAIPLSALTTMSQAGSSGCTRSALPVQPSHLSTSSPNSPTLPMRSCLGLSEQDCGSGGLQRQPDPMRADFDWLLIDLSGRRQSLPRAFAGEGGLAKRGRVGDHGNRNRSHNSKT